MARRKVGRNMKAKEFYLTEKEQIIIRTTISMEIKSSEASESLDIIPVFSTKELKALYRKIAEHEW